MRASSLGAMILAGTLLAAMSMAVSVPLGTVTLRSQPGAEVDWDGVLLGKTDEQGVLEIGNVPPGQYELFITREGFEPLRLVVDIKAGTQKISSPLTAVVAELVVAVSPETLVDPSVREAIESDDFPIWPTAMAAIVILFAAVTITHLARRRPQPAGLSLEPDGPKVVMGRVTRRSGKSPMFMRNLKRREESLDNFVEAGSSRPRRRVIEVDVGAGPVVDVRRVDRQAADDGQGEKE